MDQPNIRELATSETGEHVAFAALDGVIYIGQLSAQKIASSFSVRFSPGGRRMSVHPENDTTFVADDDGLCAFDPSGTPIWRARVRKPRYVSLSTQGDVVYCGQIDAPLLAFDASTGERLEEHDAAEQVIDGGTARATDQGKVLQLQTRGREYAIELERSVLAAAFSEDHMLIGESGGRLRFVELATGATAIVPGILEGHHMLDVCFRPGTQSFTGLQWSFLDGGRPLLCTVTESGVAILNEVPSVVTGFALSGERLITHAGELYDSRTGALVGQMEW